MTALSTYRPGTRKMLIEAVLALLLSIAASLFAAGEPQRPIVGAIRWDAWTGGPITEQVQRSLGPARYHDRLPWFAKVTEGGRVRIDGSAQAIMDQEIEFASVSGLDYWAFLLYAESDSMSLALRRYLKSSKRQDVSFCVILHNNLGVPEPEWPKERTRLVSLLKEPGYQKVRGSRPLVFEFQARFDGHFPLQRFADFRRAAQEAGLNPYCVAMGWNPAADYPRALANGFDAVSAYACGSADPTFASLCQTVEKNYWQNALNARVPYVPMATTGWDKRPRKDNPVSWEKNDAYHQQAIFPATAAPEEIASHLKRSVEFVKENPDVCAANAVIIYAWNEHDEGGWLLPTWTPTGKPNTARIEAIGRILRRN